MIPALLWLATARADCQSAPDGCDRDGDGWCVGIVVTHWPECTDGSRPGDCEEDATVLGVPPEDRNPGVTETWYDGVDEDCDGNNDFDQDRDGYVRAGDDAEVGGTAWQTGDCDDTVEGLGRWPGRFVHPGQGEIWYDGTDQNCDGQDECDRDGDGYGWPGCEVPTTVPLTDCDDAHPELHPGQPEVCEPGPWQTDTDCDGNAATQAGGPLGPDTPGAVAWYPDLDGDGAGAGVASWRCEGGVGWSATDCDADDHDAWVGCPVPDTADTADTADTIEAFRPACDEGARCGCASGGGPGLVWAAALAVLIRRRATTGR